MACLAAVATGLVLWDILATFSVRMVTLFDGSEFTVSAPFKENALRQYEGYISKTGMGRGDTSGE